MATLYVLIIYPDSDAFVLRLEGFPTMALAERAVGWQRIGQGAFDRYEICTRTGPDTFSNGRETFKAGRSPYNEGAWEEFKAQWTEPKLPAGGVS